MAEPAPPVALAAQIQRLATIHAACFTMPRPWSAAEIAALLAQPHVFLLTEPPVQNATSRDIAGFLIGSAVAGEAELLTLAVHPDHRRLGRGERLLATFLAEAGTRKATALFLEVAADNAPAIALYARAGFQEAGRRRRYYEAPGKDPIDALVFTRSL